MNIRQATPLDLDGILAIYARARAFMEETGNPTQWEGGYPSPALLSEDIAGGNLYVLAENGVLHGVFAFFPEGDADYDALDDKWLNALPYAAIHRVASAGTKRGVLAAVIRFCRDICPHLRIDTHKDNVVMQGALEKQGFHRVTEALLPDIGWRILYEAY